MPIKNIEIEVNNKNGPYEKLVQLKTELRDAKEKVASLDGLMQHYEQIYLNSVNVSWKKEVQDCLKTGAGKSILKTPSDIAECVAGMLGVEANRSVKNKIASTASLLFKEEKIGRYAEDKKTYYGMLKYFEEDRVTLTAAAIEIFRPAKQLTITDMKIFNLM